MNTYVLYHGNCYDGFGSAWSAWKRFKDEAVYISTTYGNPPPDMPECERLYILDFSYPAEVLKSLHETIPHITVLDHHKTASKDLAEFFHSVANKDHIDNPPPGIFVLFNMEESGASLSWEYFDKPQFSEQKWTPEIIQYVKDRDLWLFKKPRSKEVHAWLRSHYFDFVLWDWLNYCLTDDAQYHSVISEGTAILRSANQQVESMCQYTNWIELGGYKVPVVNATVYFSEVGDYLCQKYPDAPFSAYYLDRSDGKRQWGLRSRNDFDVSVVAKEYGGGGHSNAAGFVTPIPKFM
jgi:uncharacterized protein